MTASTRHDDASRPIAAALELRSMCGQPPEILDCSTGSPVSSVGAGVCEFGLWIGCAHPVHLVQVSGAVCVSPHGRPSGCGFCRLARPSARAASRCACGGGRACTRRCRSVRRARARHPPPGRASDRADCRSGDAATGGGGAGRRLAAGVVGLRVRDHQRASGAWSACGARRRAAPADWASAMQVARRFRTCRTQRRRWRSRRRRSDSGRPRCVRLPRTRFRPEFGMRVGDRCVVGGVASGSRAGFSAARRIRLRARRFLVLAAHVPAACGRCRARCDNTNACPAPWRPSARSGSRRLPLRCGREVPLRQRPGHSGGNKEGGCDFRLQFDIRISGYATPQITPPISSKSWVVIGRKSGEDWA